MAARAVREGAVTLSGLSSEVSGLSLGVDRTVKVRLPARFTVRHVQMMQRDCELLADKLRDHPKEMRELLEACYTNPPRAREIARSLDLSEDSFNSQGGGIIWAFVIGFVIGYIVGSESEAE